MADEETIQELAYKCRPILERKARREITVTYEDLAREVGPKVGIPDLNPHDPRLHHALGELSVSTYHRHENLLSVIVVNKETGKPGHGFFTLARDIGAYPTPRRALSQAYKDKVFEEELPKVFDHYRRR